MTAQPTSLETYFTDFGLAYRPDEETEWYMNEFFNEYQRASDFKEKENCRIEFLEKVEYYGGYFSVVNPDLFVDKVLPETKQKQYPLFLYHVLEIGTSYAAGRMLVKVKIFNKGKQQEFYQEQIEKNEKMFNRIFPKRKLEKIFMPEQTARKDLEYLMSELNVVASHLNKWQKIQGRMIETIRKGCAHFE